MKCKCHPDSPFHWKQNKRPSIFSNDKLFSPANLASSTGATLRVEDMRIKGIGIMKGISNDKEAEILRIRTYNTFSKAVPSK